MLEAPWSLETPWRTARVLVAERAAAGTSWQSKRGGRCSGDPAGSSLPLVSGQ